MRNEPTLRELDTLPRLYSTDATRLDDKTIYMHFFLGASDWYAAEYSLEDDLFFGYVILNDRYQDAEWGYFSLPELRSLRTHSGIEVDRDLYWTPTRAGAIERIARRY